MKFSQTAEVDPSWCLREGLFWDGDILGITAPDRPTPHHLIMVKNKLFLGRLMDSLSTIDTGPLGLVVEEKFWQETFQGENNPWPKLVPRFAFLATVKQIAPFITLTSKVFYDEKNASYAEDGLDGRESGKAYIHPEAKIFPNVYIGPGVSVGKGSIIHSGCSLGAGSTVAENTILFANVSVYSRVKIGSHCRIHSGTVIGSDGFGYHFMQGEHKKIWHYGGVIIEDQVEIGAGVTVDTGTFSPTIIGQGSKIDNQVQIAHNCRVGKGVILCGQVGLSGSSHIGDFSVLGGKAGVGPDVHVGRGCQVAGNAMVTGSIPDGSEVAGHPARPVREWLQGVAYLRKISLKDKR